MNGRRLFLVAIGALAAAEALPQPARVPRIGYLLLMPFVEPPSPERLAFLEGLAEFGYVAGRNVEILYASAENEPDFVDEVVRDLIRKKPDVIVVSGAITLLAAKNATKEIPVVSLAVGDPVGIGAVRSLARPEGNVTGVSFVSSDLAAKRVELIADILPKATRVALLWDTRNANARAEAGATLAALGRRRLADAQFPLRSEADLPAAFDAIGRAKADALYVVFEGGTVAGNRTAIAEFGLRHRIPVISGWSGLTAAGGLASYAPNIPAIFRRSAYYVDRILKGASPRDLPFEQPTKFELVFNVRTAKALGVTIPQSLLLRADEVIQ